MQKFNIWAALQAYRNHVGSKLYLSIFLAFFVVTADAIGIALIIPILPSLISSRSGSESSLAEFEASASFGSLTPAVVQLAEIFNISSVFALIFIVFLAKAVFVFLAIGVSAYIRAGFQEIIKKKLIQSYAESSFEKYNKITTASMINMANEQAFRSMQCFFSLNQSATQLLSAGLYFSICLFVDITVAIAIGISAAVVYVAYKSLNDKTEKLSKKLVSEKNRYLASLYDFFPHFIYLRGSGIADTISKRAVLIASSIRSTQVKLGVIGALMRASQEFFIITILLAVLYISGRYELLGVESLIFSLAMLYRGTQAILVYQNNWQATLDSIGSLDGIEKSLTQLKVSEDTERLGKTGQTSCSSTMIELKRVTYRYTSVAAFGPVSIKINCGDVIGVTGRSGAGKSTLINLMMGVIEPSKGRRVISQRLASNQQNFGYLSQPPVIFGDTFLYNITTSERLNEELSTVQRNLIDQIVNALDLEGKVKELPSGIDSEIGEGGRELSGGQRQRLALARELYRQPSILILDEGTSAQDEIGELRVLSAIKKWEWLQAVVFVTHKAGPLSICNRRFHVRKGRMREIEWNL